MCDHVSDAYRPSDAYRISQPSCRPPAAAGDDVVLDGRIGEGLNALAAGVVDGVVANHALATVLIDSSKPAVRDDVVLDGEVVVCVPNVLCHRFCLAVLVKRVQTYLVSEFGAETR